MAEHGLERFAKLNHKVVGAYWDEETSHWKVKVEPDGRPEYTFFDYSDILINATGVLKYVFVAISTKIPLLTWT